MGRLKISADKKAHSITFSVKPAHDKMLAAIITHSKQDKSSIIQKLIEDAYKAIKG